MTSTDMPDDPRAKDAHRKVPCGTDRVARGEETSLSEEEQLDLLRLTRELELAQAELENQNEELRKTARQLEAARKEFWELYEYAPVCFVTLSRKGIVQRANAAARRLLGGRPDARLTGLAFSYFVMSKDVGTYFRQVRSEKPTFFELRLTDSARDPIDAYFQVSVRFSLTGRFDGWQLAFFDVSEEKRLEESLRINREHLELATSAGRIGIWVGDFETGRSHWNAQLYRLLGLAPREGPEHQDYFFEFIHPDDRKGFLENARSVTSLEKGVDVEFRIVRADDGRVRWLKARGVIDRDRDGRPVRIRGVNYDITDRREAEERLQATQLLLSAQLAETKHVNEELSQYAYAVSHDLKAPLRAIRNYADFLHQDLADALTGEQGKYLQGLKTAVDQGDRLINDLLAYARIGRTPMDVQPADVPGLLREVRSMLDLPREVRITLHPEWPALRTDRTLLKQILQNLITNAVKFNESDPKRVEIGCRKVPGKQVELFVRDNGIGIEPDYHGQIFRIFQRLHSAKTYEGTGIGLAIVQKAVQRLGGSVRLESEPGRGSTFYVRLPLEGRSLAEQKGPGGRFDI